MKVLKEDSNKKEAVPIEFITSFISKGWDEVGSLKANIDGIRGDFKDVENVAQALQDLSDAYLVCIGQLEAYLDNKNYVEIPEVEEQEDETVELKDEEEFDELEDIGEEEDAEIKVDTEEMPVDELSDDEPEADYDDFDLDFEDAEEDEEQKSARDEWLRK